MLRALFILSLAAIAGPGTPTATAQDQRADPDFDTKVAAPTYTLRHPSVLFDEAHNNLHTAGGLYKPFADLVGHDGYRVVPNKQPLSRFVLNGYEILIIANAMAVEEQAARIELASVEREPPMMELAKEVNRADVGKPVDFVRMAVVAEGPRPAQPALRDVECKVVEGWVKAGGSLLLITDMQQWGAAVRNLADRFGVKMSHGLTIDRAHSVDGKPAWLIFTGKSGLLGDHPITRGRGPAERINRVVTYAGQSLLGPPGSIPFLRLSETATDRNPGGLRAGAAGRCQGLAMTHGKGRVVVLGEAGALSAQLGAQGPFGMNDPGNDNRQLALNIMHWLSGALPLAADLPGAPARSDLPRPDPRPGP